MGVQEMKMFMNTGMMVTDQSTLQAQTAEASTKTQAEALEMLDESTVKLAQSFEQERKRP